MTIRDRWIKEVDEFVSAMLTLTDSVPAFTANAEMRNNWNRVKRLAVFGGETLDIIVTKDLNKLEQIDVAAGKLFA